MEADLYWNDLSNSLVEVGIRMERAKRLEQGVQATTILSYKEISHRKAWLQNRVGQSDCRSEISKNGTR